jgi:hypothetical protein
VESLIAFTDRSNAIHAGHVVEQQLPNDFQMVPIDYYPNLGELYFDNIQYPIVAKVGSCHSGYGKMMFKGKNSNLDDFHGLVAMTRDFVTVEPFLDKDFEYRLQKMGKKIRVFSRESKTHDWKANVGEATIIDLPVTKRHLRIVEAVAKLYAPFEIFGLDMMVTKDGQEYCMEINDSSIGFVDPHIKEDSQSLVELISDMVKSHYGVK